MTKDDAPQNSTSDPHKWLEDILGEEPMAWVEARNKECIEALGDPFQTETYTRILSILNCKEKIPNLFQIGDKEDSLFYNFWQDDVHVQGIWRKTDLDSYTKGSPNWSTVIDIDALPPPKHDTAQNWVWHGSRLLDEPGGVMDRVLIALSPGGSDADIQREFDLVKEDWISPADGGFELPNPSKGSASYRSRNELLVGTDFGGDGSTMTDSGYPRIIKSWKRGTPLEDAVTVFEGEQTDVCVSQYAYPDRGFVHEFQNRAITFYTSKYFYRQLTAESIQTTTAAEDTTPFVEVPIPEDASVSTFADHAHVTLRTDWKPEGCEVTFKSGAMISAPLSDVMQNVWTNAVVLFEPTENKSLEDVTQTKDYVILKTLVDVQTRLVFWRYDAGKWVLEAHDEGTAAQVGEDVSISNMNRNSDLNNALWLFRDGYLVPNTQEMTNAENGCRSTTLIRSRKAMFDAEGLCVKQRFAKSLDGTLIPYFVIRREDIPFDGTTPTLLDAYGGFEVSMLPGYSGAVGAGWLEKGGIKVIANIRGGGEYGPKWHQAALKEKRHKAYEDVEAVAADLIENKITSPSKLAVIGGSNGGLLVGNMITRPVASSLFGAAVCQVPLLDMKVFNKLLAGASWMAEYGDPDTDDWKFVRRHSAYHLLRHDCLGIPEDGAEEACPVNPSWRCPKVLFTTSTRDDRVHPGHARKMVRALIEEANKEQAPEVYYWENTEGGHGGAANNKQRAHMWALTYCFLAKKLGLDALGAC